MGTAIRFTLAAAMLAAAMGLIACGRSDDDASLGGGAGGLPIASENDPIPPKDPADGLVYAELVRGDDGGPCAGMFEIASAVGDETVACTHGPDEAPPGVDDVREKATVAELKQRDDEAPPAAENAGETVAQAGGIPCVGNGTDGNRVQAIYAHASDVTDRFGQLKNSIVEWATEASDVFDASAAKKGGSRKIRWVTSNPQGSNCGLEVLNVQLPANADDSFDNTVIALQNAGYTASNRRFMVWMDANKLCGIGQIYADSNPGATNLNNGVAQVKGAIARVDQQCWGRLDIDHSVEAHELIHNLGGVQNDAPNSSGGWHCTDESDTECYSDTPNKPAMRNVCPAENEPLLDCREDDYFNAGTTGGIPTGNGGQTWNVANSSFLLQGDLGAPINNRFSNSIPLNGLTVSRDGDYNQGASKEAGEPNHAGNPGGSSIWYRWSAPTDGDVTVTTAGSSFDTVLAVYTGGGLNSLSQVAQNDNSAGTTSQATFTATAGTNYRIAVDGANGATGAIRFSLSEQAAAQPPSGGKKKASGGKKKKKKKKRKKKK